MKKITLSNVDNPDALFDHINHCKGKVELITDEGDVLNMKSKLCQIVLVAEILNNPIIKEMSLQFYDDSDFHHTMQFLMKGGSKLN